MNKFNEMLEAAKNEFKKTGRDAYARYTLGEDHYSVNVFRASGNVRPGATRATWRKNGEKITKEAAKDALSNF